jgi:hypothetical protein
VPQLANQRLNGFLRQAIWQIHRQLCVYCGNPIGYSEMEIDHIIAESLLNDPNLLSATLLSHGLPDNFEVTCLDNLVPSCRDCNGRKQAKPLLSGVANILIADAISKRNAIEILADKLNTKTRIDKGRAIVISAYQEGNLTDQDILEIMKRKDVSKTFPLSDFITLLGNDPIGEISMEHYEAYLDMPVPNLDKEGLRLFGEGGHHQKLLDGFDEARKDKDLSKEKDMLEWVDLFRRFKEELDKLDDGEIRVFTLRQYAEAIMRGCYARSSKEIADSCWQFEQPLDILHYLSTASAATKSFIDKPRVGLSDLALLPAELLQFANWSADSDASKSLNQRTIQDLISAGRAHITGIGSHFLRLEEEKSEEGWRGDFAVISEILRADISGDGLEDVLIHVGGGPITGTLRTSSVIYLSRLSSTSPFIIPKQGGWCESWESHKAN